MIIYTIHSHRMWLLPVSDRRHCSSDDFSCTWFHL